MKNEIEIGITDENVADFYFFIQYVEKPLALAMGSIQY